MIITPIRLANVPTDKKATLDLISEWENEVGVSFYYPVNAEVDLSFGYDYVTVRSLEDMTEYRDRDAHNLFASTSYSPGQTWRVGLQSSASFTE